MKKLGVILAVIIIIIALPLSVGASSESGEKLYLYDLGSFLTTTEQDKLNGRLGELSVQYNLDLTVVIADDLNGKESAQYALDFHDDNGHGEEGSIFLIDMENRRLELWNFGKFGFYMDSYYQGAIDSTTEAMQTSGQNIYAAVDNYIRYMEDNLAGWPAFLDSSDETLEYDPATDYYEYRETPTFKNILLTSFLGGLIGAVVIVGIMVFIHAGTLSGGISAVAYANSGLALKGRSDRFVHTYTSKTRRNDDNSSGGHGGGGGSMTRTSSGGSSARGGGGSF